MRWWLFLWVIRIFDWGEHFFWSLYVNKISTVYSSSQFTFATKQVLINVNITIRDIISRELKRWRNNDTMGFFPRSLFDEKLKKTWEYCFCDKKKKPHRVRRSNVVQENLLLCCIAHKYFSLSDRKKFKVQRM
jgi:hypothetical protein